MSHKHYRAPARAPHTEFAPPAEIYRTPAAAPQTGAALSPEDQALFGAIKRFLHQVVEKVSKALEDVPLPADAVNGEARVDSRRQIAVLARIGISACRTLIQALRMTGAETSALKAMMKDVVARFERRIEPALAAG